MKMALMFLDADGGGRKREAGSGKDTLQFSKMRLSQARSVLHHSRSLAESVVKGITPLDAALATVCGSLTALVLSLLVASRRRCFIKLKGLKARRRLSLRTMPPA